MTEKEKRAFFVELMQKNSYIVKKNFQDNTYIEIEAVSNVCLDYQKLFIKLENQKIIDIKFFAESCLISKSATNLWIEELVGSNITNALKQITNFENFINNKPFNDNGNIMFQLFSNVRETKNRINCALFGILRIKTILERAANA